jgi:hypothetical protein
MKKYSLIITKFVENRKIKIKILKNRNPRDQDKFINFQFQQLAKEKIYYCKKIVKLNA